MNPASPDKPLTVRGPRLPFELIVMILENLTFEKIFSFDDGEVMLETILAKLNHGDFLEVRFLKLLSEHPQIFSRLTRMNVNQIGEGYWRTEEIEGEHGLRLLEGVLKQCPNITYLALAITTGACHTMIEAHPYLLRRLTKLDLTDGS